MQLQVTSSPPYRHARVQSDSTAEKKLRSCCGASDDCYTPAGSKAEAWQVAYHIPAGLSPGPCGPLFQKRLQCDGTAALDQAETCGAAQLALLRSLHQQVTLSHLYLPSNPSNSLRQHMSCRCGLSRSRQMHFSSRPLVSTRQYGVCTNIPKWRQWCGRMQLTHQSQP